MENKIVEVSKIITKLEWIYDDFKEHYVTVDEFRDDYDITRIEFEILIEAGRKLKNRF